MGNIGNFNSAYKNNRKRKRCKKQLGTHSTGKVICNECLYFMTVIQFDPKSYDIAMADLVHQINASQKSFP